MYVSGKYCVEKFSNTVQYSEKIPFVIGKLILRKPLKFHRREIKRAKTFITQGEWHDDIARNCQCSSINNVLKFHRKILFTKLIVFTRFQRLGNVKKGSRNNISISYFYPNLSFFNASNYVVADYVNYFTFSLIILS